MADPSLAKGEVLALETVGAHGPAERAGELPND